MKTAIRAIVLLTVVLTAAGCETRLPAMDAERGRAVLPPLPPLITEGARVYRVQPDLSEIRVLVYRGGSMASLGHNHVVSSNRLMGNIYLRDEFGKTGFDMTLPVDSFYVDRPEQRREEGADFAAAVSADAISGTRRNMLGVEVLDGTHFPLIKIRSAAVSGNPANPVLTARFTVRGVSRDLALPLRLQYDGRQLTASGETGISQTLFGIVPYSVMLGALTVRDTLRVKYRIVAHTQ